MPDLTGLSSPQAVALLHQYGPNQLPANRLNAPRILFRQFASSFLLLLLAAVIISFLLGELIDAGLILIFIAINTLLGFFQEYRSEKTISLLNKYTVGQARVRRDGRDITLPTPELVPSDLVSISVGDIIPADLRLLTCSGLQIDESTLTGESGPVAKAPPDSVFMGTIVTAGTATGQVVSTGARTRFGSLGKLATLTHRSSSYEKSLNAYSRFILKLVLVTLALLILANLALKPSPNLPELLLFCIALAVSVVPEALPVVTTFSLSRGARILARHKVVVKRLTAIEDLGSIDILCTDKTGTLTENTLTVHAIFGPHPDQVIVHAAIAGLTGTDPFDVAIASRLPSPLSGYTLVDHIPFDPLRRRVSVIASHHSARYLVSRGALDNIVSICRPTTYSAAATAWAISEGQAGRRVIAVARKPLRSLPAHLTSAETGLEFVGLISFTDPIKASTPEAISTARRLGVVIKIATGDAPEVAGTVACQIGLITDPKQVMLGSTFAQLSPDQRLTAAQTYHVFARVTPEQKYLLIQTLQSRYQVGFLGEGINDAPALKIAHVGLAVQSASDISRESADIILLQKSLHVVINGIHEGRQVFANTTKYLKATLSSNFGNFYAVAVASLLIPYLPMLPLQILLVNLLSDFPMITVATDTVDPSELVKPQKYSIRLVLILATTLGLVSTLFDFLFFAYFSRFSPASLQTNWFIGSILTELALIFSIRTPRFFLHSRPPSPLLAGLCLLTACITVILPFTSFGHTVLKFISPSPADLLTIAILVIVYFLTSESVKLAFYRKFLNTSKNLP